MLEGSTAVRVKRRRNKRQMRERNEDKSGKIASRKDENSAEQMLNPVVLSQVHGAKFFVCFAFCFCVFLRQGFSLALKPFLKLALVDQAGLEHSEIYLPLSPKSEIKGLYNQRLVGLHFQRA